ncbi:tyrosine-type recombinase/integrase [Novosphingobium sp. Gsoil 351]|nr:tyrosine-type recombinase/integrase [Novosphingobium sp. Gsoil 351]
MPVRNKLSVKGVAAAKKPGVYSDGGGLYLRVRPSGSKSWLFIRTSKGLRRELGLGSALDVSLALARERAEALRTRATNGLDLVPANSLSDAEAPTTVTFEEFAKEYIRSIQGGFDNAKHRQQWQTTVATYTASFARTPIDKVGRDNILEVLRPIWLSKPETARRVQQRVARILDAAKVRGLRQGDNPAQWQGNLQLLLPRQDKSVAHHAALPFRGLPNFMKDLAQRQGTAARALEFTIFTAARSGEVLGMRWEEVDLENRLWTVPADRMKARVQHEVPLDAAATALLRSMKTQATMLEDFVFGAEPKKALSNMAMTALLRRMGRGDITVHGFRSTFRDWAGDVTSHAREDVEMALAHTIASKAERAYRRGRSLEKRRVLMSEWADFANGLQRA